MLAITMISAFIIAPMILALVPIAMAAVIVVVQIGADSAAGESYVTAPAFAGTNMCAAE